MNTVAAPPQIPAPTLRTALRFVARTPVTWAFLAVLAAMQVIWTYGTATLLGGIVAAASTNVDNLSSGHLSTLITSAFVLDDGNAWVLLPLVGAALAAGELLWGSRTLIGLFAIGHIGATLIVFVGLLLGTHLSLVSTAVDNAADVGISYGLAAVIGALAFEMPRRYGAIWATAWLGLVAIALVAAPSFTAWGHCTALAIGLGVGALSEKGRSPAAVGWSDRRLANVSGDLGLGFIMTTAGFAISMAAVIGFMEIADGGSLQSLAVVVAAFGAALAIGARGTTDASRSGSAPTRPDEDERSRRMPMLLGARDSRTEAACQNRTDGMLFAGELRGLLLREGLRTDLGVLGHEDLFAQ